VTHRLSILVAVFVAAAFPLAAASNDAAWIADIDRLATELPRLHVDAFARISREVFDGAIQQLRNDVPTLADHEVAVGLLRAVALIGDSHTTLYGVPSSSFSIAFQWFSDGLYVVSTAERDRDLVGARVVGIGGRSIDDALASVATVIPHENEFWLRERAAGFLSTPEILHALRIIPTIHLGSFTFVLRDGSVIERDFEQKARAAVQWVDEPSEDRRPLYLRNAEANYWHAYIPESQTLFVKYNRCAEMPSLPMAEFGRQLGAFVRANPVTRLVLDLRHNGGGDSGLLQPMLMDAYTSAPGLDDPNRFFVLIGPRTFSSAMMNAIELDAVTRATLVGLPTGGKPNHFGNLATFTLTNSRIVVQYSTRHYTLSENDPPALMPEIEVGLSSTDYFNGVDPVMERIAPPLPRRRAARR